jgi:hypothetical protein
MASKPVQVRLDEETVAWLKHKGPSVSQAIKDCIQMARTGRPSVDDPDAPSDETPEKNLAPATQFVQTAEGPVPVGPTTYRRLMASQLPPRQAFAPMPHLESCACAMCKG